MVIGLILVTTYLTYKGGGEVVLQFVSYFTQGMFSLVPANIFIASSKHLQTVTDTYKVLKEIFTKNL